MHDAFVLDPSIRHLNHGSFGATPRAVLAVQEEWRARMEREPVRFFARELFGHLEQAIARLAEFIGAEPEDVVPVRNATEGVNAVLRSFPLAAGDELLVTNHGYNACRNAAAFVCERAGARVVTAQLPFPLESEEEALDAVLAAVTPRTRLALLDHVTSPTGLVLPLERIVPALAERGVPTLVDGAHAPGMLELDVPSIGAAYYTGNGHKWLCGPKGAGFLWVRRDLQEMVRPTVISHGANSPRPGRSRFQVEFSWTGTSDPSAFLSLPAAIDTLAGLVPGGWEALRARNRALALEGRRLLCAALGVPTPAPDSMIGFLAAVPLPEGQRPGPASDTGAFDVDPLQRLLYEEHAIEVPVFPFPAPPRRLVRFSVQVYVERGDLEALADALRGCAPD